MILTVLGISLTAPVQAGTTTADFLKWEEGQQDSFFQISLTMAATVATQVRPEMAECLDGWYFESNDLQQQRHREILERMPSLSEYQPSAIVLAFVEAACGKYLE